jgi:hypothetical protein
LLFFTLLLFFKLIFIENILVFKQENYKTRNIVKKSFAIIKSNILFYTSTYFGITIFLLYIGERIFKNNFIFIIFEGIVYACLFIVYQIKFVENQIRNKNV